MARPTRTLIIHGWSDCSESFVAIKTFLIESGIGEPTSIYYADYQSREDSITFDDVADGLNVQLIKGGFIDQDGKPLVDLNVIVHSTGGLVIRHWLSRYYMGPTPNLNDCPIKKLVMLAPANFGSPLAQRGKSFLGELIKGRWKVGDLWEVGRILLNGLELGSEYQWDLAHRDLLTGCVPYSAGGIQLTILVGVQDYAGLKSLVNKPGTDGTVVIAGTSLDTLKLTLDCTKPADANGSYQPYTWGQAKTAEEFAFGVLPGLDHGTIVSDCGKPAGGTVGPLLLRALGTADPDAFRAHAQDLDEVTRQTYAATGKPVFQQFIVHAVDESDNSIPDFTLEFYICSADRVEQGLVTSEDDLEPAERALSDIANQIITAEFHPYSQDPSFRRFLIDLPALRALLAKAASDQDGCLGGPVALSMRVYVPKVDEGITYDIGNLQNIVLVRTDQKSKGPTFLYENTTTLLELRVRRDCSLIRVGTDPIKE